MDQTGSRPEDEAAPRHWRGWLGFSDDLTVVHLGNGISA